MFIWHSVTSAERPILDRYYMKRWVRVPGGSSVGTRAIPLLYMLGVRTLRVYGMDCSQRGGKTHAYKQRENEGEKPHTVRVGRRRFRSSVAMIAQLDELLQLAGTLPEDLCVSFEGDGLWQHVLRLTHERGECPRIVIER